MAYYFARERKGKRATKKKFCSPWGNERKAREVSRREKGLKDWYPHRGDVRQVNKADQKRGKGFAGRKRERGN